MPGINIQRGPGTLHAPTEILFGRPAKNRLTLHGWAMGDAYRVWGAATTEGHVVPNRQCCWKSYEERREHGGSSGITCWAPRPRESSPRSRGTSEVQLGLPATVAHPSPRGIGEPQWSVGLLCTVLRHQLSTRRRAGTVPILGSWRQRGRTAGHQRLCPELVVAAQAGRAPLP